MYSKAVKLMSDDAKEMITGFMQRKYNRDDFDLLEWVDDNHVAQFALDTYLDCGQPVAEWDESIEGAADKILAVVLSGDEFTDKTKEILVRLLRAEIGG